MQDLNPGPQTPNRQQTECLLTNRLSYRGSSKNLNSTARPYDQRAFSPLDPTVSWLSHLALAIYIFVVVNFDALAQASDIQIERRQVVFLYWMQDLNPGPISHVNVTQTVPDISPLMPMHQDPLLVATSIHTEIILSCIDYHSQQRSLAQYLIEYYRLLSGIRFAPLCIWNLLTWINQSVVR